MSASQPPTPAVSTAINTSRASGTGTGSEWIDNTSGPPKRSIAAARMVFGIVCILQNPAITPVSSVCVNRQYVLTSH
jgi:hypothetical protein